MPKRKPVTLTPEMEAAFRRVSNEVITVKIAGRIEKMTCQQALFWTIRQQSQKDIGAMKLMMKLESELIPKSTIPANPLSQHIVQTDKGPAIRYYVQTEEISLIESIRDELGMYFDPDLAPPRQDQSDER